MSPFRKPSPDMSVDEQLEDLRSALRTMAVGLICAILFLGALGGLAIWNAGRIDNGVQDTLVHNQRCDLEVRIGQSEQFLDESAGDEPGLADYIRRVTLPDLHKRLRALPPDGECETAPKTP